MVIQDKYYDQGDLAEPSTDSPPSYETIAAAGAAQPSSGPAYSPDDKLTGQRSGITRGPGFGSTSPPDGQPSQSNLSSQLSRSSSPSPHTSKQVRQTVCALIRDLVFNAESPNLLDSCASACRTYRLDFAALLQDPFIERHSAIFWAILNGRDALLPSLLVHAAPFSWPTLFEIRLACLATGNQHLFQSLRCKYASEMTPLSGTGALVLGSTPADEVSIREIEGQGAFVAEMRINLWQKRLRVSGVVDVEFIARGRLWYLCFFSSQSSTTIGRWHVVLRLQDPSPPTFIDSTLVIEPPPLSPSSSTPATNASQASGLVSLSPPSDTSSRVAEHSPPSPAPLPKFNTKFKTPQVIELRLSSTHRLAYRSSNTVQQWTDGDSTYTSAIVVPLYNGAGAELFYDNNPFIAMDGTLYARLEARLERPGAIESS